MQNQQQQQQQQKQHSVTFSVNDVKVEEILSIHHQNHFPISKHFQQQNILESKQMKM